MPYHSEDRTILVGNSDFLCSFEVGDGEVLIESIRIRDHGANSFGTGIDLGTVGMLFVLEPHGPVALYDHLITRSGLSPRVAARQVA